MQRAYIQDTWKLSHCTSVYFWNTSIAECWFKIFASWVTIVNQRWEITFQTSISLFGRLTDCWHISQTVERWRRYVTATAVKRNSVSLLGRVWHCLTLSPHFQLWQTEAAAVKKPGQVKQVGQLARWHNARPFLQEFLLRYKYKNTDANTVTYTYANWASWPAGALAEAQVSAGLTCPCPILQSILPAPSFPPILHFLSVRWANLQVSK